MAGIKDVAKAAGVSVSTVSYVFSGKRTISRRTIDKVMAVVDDLGYVPDYGAQRIHGGHSNIIALSEPIRKGMNQTEFSSYFLQSAKFAKKAGFDSLLLPSEKDSVADIVRVLNSNLADGVVLLDIVEDDERVHYAASYGKPCVAIGYPREHHDCACIDIDFARMGMLAAERLHRLGHRIIAFLRDLEVHYTRRSGYVNLFHEAFLHRAWSLAMRVVESSAVEYATFNPEEYCESLYQGPSVPTAIVSQTDSKILNEVIDALGRRGVSVPSGMSVLSCGTYFVAEQMRRSISEMPLDPERLCRRAMDTLVDAIESDTVIDGGVSELIQPRYIDRGSLISVALMNTSHRFIHGTGS